MSETSKNNEGAEFRAEIDNQLLHSVAAEPATANTKELYKALAIVAREQLAKRWVQTQIDDRRNKSRRIYYMSMEFLIGVITSYSIHYTKLYDSNFCKRSELSTTSSELPDMPMPAIHGSYNFV